jgi:hypothetical protein
MHSTSCGGARSRKLSNIGRSSDGRPKIYYLELLRVSEGTLSCWSRLYLQSLVPTNPHWALVVDYGPFSLYPQGTRRTIHKEGLWPNSGGIISLMIFASYPYPTMWGRYNMFLSCCDKDLAVIFTTGRLPDVNPP